MNRFLRIISTAVVGIGLVLLFVFLGFRNTVDKTQVLNQPSYYTLQNYWYLLLAGCGCIAFSIISCFLSWNKEMDEKVEILPNAVGADKAALMKWLSGSSLDTKERSDRDAEGASDKKPDNHGAVLKKKKEIVTQIIRAGYAHKEETTDEKDFTETAAGSRLTDDTILENITQIENGTAESETVFEPTGNTEKTENQYVDDETIIMRHEEGRHDL